jgi:hypothetical protein
MTRSSYLSSTSNEDHVFESNVSTSSPERCFECGNAVVPLWNGQDRMVEYNKISSSPKRPDQEVQWS